MLSDETKYKRHLVMRTDNWFPVIAEEDMNNAKFKLAEYERIGTPEQFEKAMKFYKNFSKFIEELDF